jgi:hypothetical protein
MLGHSLCQSCRLSGWCDLMSRAPSWAPEVMGSRLGFPPAGARPTKNVIPRPRPPFLFPLSVQASCRLRAWYLPIATDKAGLSVVIVKDFSYSEQSASRAWRQGLRLTCVHPHCRRCSGGERAGVAGCFGKNRLGRNHLGKDRLGKDRLFKARGRSVRDGPAGQRKMSSPPPPADRSRRSARLQVGHVGEGRSLLQGRNLLKESPKEISYRT